MSTVSDFINILAQKAGIPADNASLKDVLAHADLAKITLPDELEASINANLHTIESAKNNKDVRKVLQAQILNGVDSEVNQLMDDLGFDDVVKAELLAEKNSVKRAKLAAKRAIELNAEKAGGTKEDKSELTKTINDLKLAISNQTTAHNAAMEQLKSEHNNNLTSFMVRNKLATYEYGLPVNDADVKLETAQVLLNKALQTKQAKLVNENNMLKLLAQDGTQFFNEKNMPVSVDDFIMGAITPILKKSDSGNKPASTNGFQQQPPPQHKEGFSPNQAAIDAINAQLGTFATSK